MDKIELYVEYEDWEEGYMGRPYTESKIITLDKSQLLILKKALEELEDDSLSTSN